VVGQLNSLSTTTPAAGYATQKDELYHDNGSLTGSFANEPTNQLKPQALSVPTAPDANVSMGAGGSSEMPQLQGAVNGTIEPQGMGPQSLTMQAVPSGQSGQGHLGFDSPWPQQQQQMAKRSEAADAGEFQSTDSGIIRFLVTFFLMLIPMIMLAFGGIYYNTKRAKKNDK
jgi:hypothetical protein